MRRWMIGIAVGVMALGIGAGSGAGGSDARKGGIFRISLAIGSGIDSLDPALEYTAPGWHLLDTTCARLMTYPDKPVREAFRLVPEVATGFPKRSRDLRTYTFTLRKGFRFSDGKPVRATAFARAINRALAPEASSPWASQLRDVVGADDVLAGRSRTATGVVARGNTLTVRFTQPVTDFATRTAMPFMCAVPPTLPPDREGWTVIAAAGPYHVVGYRPNEAVTIRRNPFYRGTRPTSRRRLQRRPQRPIARRDDPAGGPRRSRLGSHHRSAVLLAAAQPLPEARAQQGAVLRQARADPAPACLQLEPAAVP